MKTGIQMVKDVYGVINVDAINTLINGGNYLFERPANSQKFDIVSNTLALTSVQIQQGIVNVNLHAPNTRGVVIDGQTDNTQPDITSMETVCTAVVGLLKDYTGFDFSLSTQNGGLPVRDTDGTWYVNIRVNYYSFQKNYTNI